MVNTGNCDLVSAPVTNSKTSVWVETRQKQIIINQVGGQDEEEIGKLEQKQEKKTNRYDNKEKK